MYKELVCIIIISYYKIYNIVYCLIFIYNKGLTLLKVRIAAWRYDRGTRSLEQNLLSTEPKIIETTIVQSTEEDDDEISSFLEDIIQELMEGLKDTDIIVR